MTRSTTASTDRTQQGVSGDRNAPANAGASVPKGSMSPSQVAPPSRPNFINPYTPIPENRIHPRDRDYMRYHDMHGHYFWGRHDHYFGHRIYRLPPHAIRHYYHGRYYWCYDDIWYYRRNGLYYVCRPPYGYYFTRAIVIERTFRPVVFSYYNTLYRNYTTLNDNWKFIDEQNAIIAKNNEIIAQQQAIIAQNNQLIAQKSAEIKAKDAALAAQNAAAAARHSIDQKNNSAYSTEAFDISNDLGLVQVYADASLDYYYQDGIFYVVDGDNYKVVIPPAGARVETLPDDYDLVTLKDGMEYYRVDDTIYMITMNDGRAYFEVLGQYYED